LEESLFRLLTTLIPTVNLWFKLASKLEDEKPNPKRTAWSIKKNTDKKFNVLLGDKKQRLFSIHMLACVKFNA
jgi:hypothetical protein